MRILQIITLSEPGGAQSVVINLSNSLCKSNDVCVVSDCGGAMWNLLDKRIKQVQLKSLKRAISPINDFKVMIAIRRIYSQFKPDIIHLHSSKIGAIGRLCLPSSKIVYTMHGFDTIRVAYRKFLPIEKFLKNRAAKIVGVSIYDKERMKEEGLSKNVEYVYNGIMPVVCDKPMPKLCNNSRQTVLCIARIDPQKYFELFVDVAKLLPMYNFVWIGNRSEPQIELPDNVICKGIIPEASKYYTVADLCILPSHYEGLPMTIIEAMSCSKPIVASNVGGISEIVKDGENGYALPNEANIFAEKIEYILSNKNIYEAMCKNAYATYQTNLTVDKMVDGYMQIYKQITKK